ncbi:MAG: hypothetical protein ACTSPX_06370 [Candidatus Thorarchaeota archaeon]
MSQYTRNNSMVACVIAVVIIGATITGMLAMTHSPGGVWFGNNEAYTTFSFKENAATPPSNVDLVIKLSTGRVNISFVNDPTLVYDIAVRVPNVSLAQHNDPSVIYADGHVRLDYEVGEITVLLGNASAYSMTLDVATGSVEISLGSHSHFHDVTVNVATGEVAVEMTSDATVVGNASVLLSVATGSINVTLAAPPEVGIRFTASTTVGPMNIATTWGNVSNGVA